MHPKLKINLNRKKANNLRHQQFRNGQKPKNRSGVRPPKLTHQPDAYPQKHLGIRSPTV
ncbi:MAG: hypothetical protein WBA89_14415 [Microcoleus sp.]|uniref:hypothetical protein n=1 Tax=Microcoleus sp. TaxID=44472 RepID=UPI003C768FE6